MIIWKKEKQGANLNAKGAGFILNLKDRNTWKCSCEMQDLMSVKFLP